MFNLYLCKPYQSNDIIIPLNIEQGGLANATLEMGDKVPYILEIEITPALNCYNELISDLSFGLRLQTFWQNTLDQDLIFVKSPEAVKLSQEGNVMIKFMSNMSRLIDNIPRQVPRFQVISGSAQSYINSLVPGWSFNFVSSDQQLLAFDSGDSGTYKLLSEICKNLGNWTFRDGGIKNGVQTIDIGDFNQLDVKYKAEDKIRLNTEVLINKIEKEKKDNVITHIYPKINSGNGSVNSYVFFTDPNANFLDSKYPLEPLGDLVFVDGQTRRLHNIINQKAIDEGYPRKQLDEVYENIQQFAENGVAKYSNAVLQELAYRKAIQTLREQGQTESYKLDLTYKRLILPCSKIYIDNLNTFYTDKFGQNIIIEIKQKTFYQNDIDINLTDIYEQS